MTTTPIPCSRCRMAVSPLTVESNNMPHLMSPGVWCEPAGVWRDPSVGEPWCPDHGYGCEPSGCPCGHTLRCDCWDIAKEH